MKIEPQTERMGSYLSSGTLGPSSLDSFLEDKGDRPAESNSQLQNSGELAQAIGLVLNRYLMNAAVPEPSKTISDACYRT